MKRLIAVSCAVVISMYIGAVIGYNIRPSHEARVSSTNVEPLTQEVLNHLVNDLREKESLTTFTIDGALSDAALAKCNDMSEKDYWSHDTPKGEEPWVFIKNAGYSYLAAGENLAYGYTKPSEVVKSWINSPGHLENLVNPKYNEAGYGICRPDTYQGKKNQIIVVQFLAQSTQ